MVDAYDRRGPLVGNPVRPQCSEDFVDKDVADKSVFPVDSRKKETHPDTAGPSAGHDGIPDVDGEDEGGHEEFAQKAKMGPYTPTSMEREHHNCTGHAVYRSWCPSCVKGRGRSSPHTARDHVEDETPVIS